MCMAISFPLFCFHSKSWWRMQAAHHAASSCRLALPMQSCACSCVAEPAKIAPSHALTIIAYSLSVAYEIFLARTHCLAQLF
jgi:hypothetical protein